jgi:ribosome-associated protein
VVTERFVELLRDALHVPKPRRKTRVPRSAKEERLRSKKQRAEIKKMRKPVALD